MNYNYQDDEKKDNKKIKKLLIIAIIALLVLFFIFLVLLLYKEQNPSKITTYIDNVKIIGNSELKDFEEVIDVHTDENGKTVMYIPIREFATYLNSVNSSFKYLTFNGDYEPKTEEDNKCYVLRQNYEVAIFIEDSKIVYKKNLQKNSEDYEECNIDKDIFKSNGKLYASVDGIEKAFNIRFNYDEKKKKIEIYTLDYIIKAYSDNLKKNKIGEYGTLKIESNNYTNWKSIFENLLIVSTSSGKYGILKDDLSGFVLEPQYDDIDYIVDSKTFSVKSDGKVGLFSKDGKRKIDLTYDQILSMGQNSNLYMVKINGQYGVVDENGQNVIYPQYSKIGINVDSFSYNNVKNGYILLEKLIPVQYENKWAIYNINTKSFVTNGFIYDKIGCTSIKSGSNIYPVLIIPEANILVVGDQYGKYWFMDENGNDTFLPHLFDKVYIQTSNGVPTYYMVNNEQEYDIINYINYINQK